MSKFRDLTEKQFEDACAKFGFAPGILGMEAVVDDNGRTVIVSYVYDGKCNIRRRASLAKLHRRVDAEPELVS
jgi:hypothetical protein